MNYGVALALLASIAGCTTNGAVGKTHEQLQAELQLIADRCSPEGKLKFELVGTKQLRLRPDQSVSYTEVDCFIAGIEPYNFDLWFTGNEAT